ncbi:hypothetical protein BDZ97DRAFT_1794504 [Flammula alnicola]|nr:hypothetical protein BDZ97DRAFT_1794504 [Flammula alnicola]
MDSAEPSWRIKTRPCPFYQQGRCLFSDSCNFLHTASSRVDPEVKTVNTEPGAPHTPHNPPRVIVDSPQSVLSSPRSPRTTSLLLALRDVIGDPDNEDNGTVTVQPTASNSETDTWSDSLPTLVNDSGFGHFSRDHDEDTLEQEFISYEDEDIDSEANWTAISDYDDDTATRPVQAIDMHSTENPVGNDELSTPITPVNIGDENSLPDHGVARSTNRDSVASGSGSGLLSPIELSNFILDSNSFDSGYADNWKPPIPMLASPPRSPSVSSTFDLLSSPFGSHSARIHSPHLSAFMPRTVSPSIAEDIEPLDLGLDSPVNQTTYVTPPDSPSGHSEIEAANQHEKVDESNDDEFVEQDSYGHTSIWDSKQEVDDAIERSSNTPTHFLDSELDFHDEEAVGNSSIVNEGGNSVDLNDAEDDGIPISQSPSASAETNPTLSDDDDTAFLAYLKSPMAAQNENDTLNSLYDAYSGIAPSGSPIPDSTHNAGLSPRYPDPSSLSSSSTPASSLRERVFTPPPVTRKRSGTITADSPNSLSSPMTSLDSVSMGRSSPFSDKFSAGGPRSESPSVQEVEVSRKIPFGFRSTFALGRASRSSLMTSRNGGKSIPSSPLQTHEEVREPEPQNSDSDPSSSSHVPKGLKPLRLSTILDAKINSRPKNHSLMPSSSVKSVNSFRNSGNINRTSISSASVSSNNSFSDNRLLSSARSSLLPLHIRNSILASEQRPSSPLSPQLFQDLAALDEPQSAPVGFWRKSINYSRPSSRLSEPFYEHEDDDSEDTIRTIRRPIPAAPHTAPTPKPNLMFAIASDDVEQVRQVLASGIAGPNDSVGPQSALEFTLTNDKLSNKLDIVKALLAYGADPTVAKKVEVRAPAHQEEGDAQQSEEPLPPRTLLDEMDPATRYYLERADSIHTRRMSVLIHRSFFRPLTRVQYDLIGQDRALEQLFRVLSMHSRELAVSPMVVMLCGPSGHGKSLLARKFGSLLDVPTHTVNMTTLRSTHDLWESHSMSPYETPTTCTLAEFLINNEGKRCVVVLDEIEKTEDPKTLWSLLMPWELGRCAFEAGKRHVDVKNVIWLGTSNIGHDLVFQHRDSRKNAEDLIPKVSERLGASVLSRITTVLREEAICSEALYTLGGELARSLSPEVIETAIDNALANYCAVEGANII